ncbi:uncharacterized protein PGTG_03641 [Puccinia graminis f. sp. tritici CRL 75-36-700-3]|uniref:Uncharacterized protein n=1 Tax=Puccinia graminis f. sp. tritici (strain CRL 75-36-700-3 / race SCCL) TaxID=418459 RepID=E3K060_PUCGT|nr:uncharacterized protein PGTG_03641 [Puccinia graminis f. sp. tritici CRL 75-36-700-3]EFP77685.1 hypothetical protein PGTG_03641 [Puccinia graminis f. sp. tritici CRL 75-36-700-3]
MSFTEFGRSDSHLRGWTACGPSAGGLSDVPNIWESELQYLGVKSHHTAQELDSTDKFTLGHHGGVTGTHLDQQLPNSGQHITRISSIITCHQSQLQTSSYTDTLTKKTHVIAQKGRACTSTIPFSIQQKGSYNHFLSLTAGIHGYLLRYLLRPTDTRQRVQMAILPEKAAGYPDAEKSFWKTGDNNPINWRESLLVDRVVIPVKQKGFLPVDEIVIPHQWEGIPPG